MAGTAAKTETKWRDMSPTDKLVWWGKLAVAVCTFGFAFPRVMDTHLRDD